MDITTEALVGKVFIFDSIFCFSFIIADRSANPCIVKEVQLALHQNADVYVYDVYHTIICSGMRRMARMKRHINNVQLVHLIDLL